MLKLFRIIIISFPVLWTNCLSQTISHDVLVPLAGVVSDGPVSISQTVGETVIETTGCSYYVLTQGFQQNSVAGFVDWEQDSKIRVYPNPASDYITVEMIGDEARSYQIEFMDLTGRIFISAKKCFGDDYWYSEPYNVKNLLPGLYMVRIKTEDGLFNRTFRIQKI
jgi:hypothetical protein